MGRRAFLRVVTHILMLYFLCQNVKSFYKQADYYYAPRHPAIEFEHAAIMYTTEKPLNISGSDVLVKDPINTPDFRIEEPPYTRYYDTHFDEEERPYRISPHYKQTTRWRNRNLKNGKHVFLPIMMHMQYRVKLTRLVTGELARTLTELGQQMLGLRRKLKNGKHVFLLIMMLIIASLEGVLGYWYDYDSNVLNSSLYGTPARIHYHPQYIRPNDVNRSHPIPAVFDLAVWAATYRMYTPALLGGRVVICDRGGSHWMQHGAAVPKPNDLSIIVGWQFMKAFKRKPMPWFKYAIRTRKHIWPCPKVEWGWFNCFIGNWAKLGLDSGATLFRVLRGSWLYDGLIGMNVVSMRLRSYEMIHYFQVLDAHPVLDFLYDAYMGYLDYEFLDDRFTDSKGRSPAPKNDDLIYWNYSFGQDLYIYDLPNY